MDIYAITAKDWSIKLGGDAEIVADVDDVQQCINIILSTPLGSDPLRPDFGADIMPYIDAPLSVAIPGLVKAAYDAIQRWEPRAQISSVKHAVEESGVRIIVEWEAADGTVASTGVLYDVARS